MASRSVSEATRPVIDRLARELSLCIRYHSVTFRGQRLYRLVVGGGEACDVLVASLDQRLETFARQLENEAQFTRAMIGKLQVPSYAELHTANGRG